MVAKKLSKCFNSKTLDLHQNASHTYLELEDNSFVMGILKYLISSFTQRGEFVDDDQGSIKLCNVATALRAEQGACEPVSKREMWGREREILAHKAFAHSSKRVRNARERLAHKAFAHSSKRARNARERLAHST